MPKFLVTYHGSTMSHDPEAMAKARDAFMRWAQKTGSALVEPGAPVVGATTVSSDGTKDGVADGPFNGWSVVEAADMNAAAKVVADHPFIGRGGILQISEPAPVWLRRSREAGSRLLPRETSAHTA